MGHLIGLRRQRIPLIPSEADQSDEKRDAVEIPENPPQRFHFHLNLNQGQAHPQAAAPSQQSGPLVPSVQTVQQEA